MALDGIVEEYLQMRRQQGAAGAETPDPAALRMEETALRARHGTGPEMAAVENFDVDVSGGSIRVRLLWPNLVPEAVVVYFHGGGWVVGDIDDYDALARTFAQDTGCVVAMVNYRKAPEHRYPTAVNDALEGAIWVEARVAGSLGRRIPLIVAGDSAGGNLAAVLAQQSTDNSAPRIDLQVLIYPVLDSTMDSPSYLDPANALLLTRDYMAWFWDQYAPRLADRSTVAAAPARASSLEGLPPAIIVAAEHDVLRDEGEAYARRLKADGVKVAHRVFSGQMHGFFSLHNVLPASELARTWVAAEIIRYLRAVKPAQDQISRKVPS
ncbi:alpha/beta hydrolase [Arthrobacter crystallopoietes]|uniref:alpha/beta hydrolase n=1 Tax=Crystallibacter crystallopoietes TaxID=37928 RepID=UPI0011112C58|nr:alpha/beta hydrolase [Arthrobacter crystallopoietes]